MLPNLPLFSVRPVSYQLLPIINYKENSAASINNILSYPVKKYGIVLPRPKNLLSTQYIFESTTISEHTIFNTQPSAQIFKEKSKNGEPDFR
ncbi:hypothetical protein XCR1_980055 [Xenorhabdus cabanillasii JM26]|uniref:Uncharacterized protein n=1 Tax=Xenorhabdus cabanillasii JM26 TaxID=1427517 RepID=W1JCY3_9GAMM|nr:hypothetical protein XCR1_980055 [Xenorhabdus cabanillasii JM26]